MKWIRFRHGEDVGFGSIDGDTVVVHQGDLWDAPKVTDVRLRLADIEWLIPCQPGKMIGLWNNFNALAEKNGWSRPAEPLYFLKAPNSYCAHTQPIRPPDIDVGRIAYEGELAIVIGRLARAVSVDSARASLPITIASSPS